MYRKPNPTKIRDYASAQRYLGKRKQRKLCNNTWLVRDEGLIHVRLHETFVVTYSSDGIIRLTTGGWRTVTTVDRINNYSPARIDIKRGLWVLRWAGREYIYQDCCLPRDRRRRPIATESFAVLNTYGEYKRREQTIAEVRAQIRRLDRRLGQYPVRLSMGSLLGPRLAQLLKYKSGHFWIAMDQQHVQAEVAATAAAAKAALPIEHHSDKQLRVITLDKVKHGREEHIR